MSHPDDLGEVNWVVTLEVPADLPEGADADEFLHHLTTAASERFGATGQQAAASDQPFPHHALRLTGSESRSQLWPARSEQGLLLFIAGPEPLPDELAVWQDALAEAKERLSGRGIEFKWAVILGPDPDDLFAGASTFEPFTIGGMTVRPARHPLCEWRETTNNLTSRRSSKTWPVIVEGTSAGYIWDAASRRAAADLRRVPRSCRLPVAIPGSPGRTRPSLSRASSMCPRSSRCSKGSTRQSSALTARRSLPRNGFRTLWRSSTPKTTSATRS